MEKQDQGVQIPFKWMGFAFCILSIGIAIIVPDSQFLAGFLLGAGILMIGL